MEQTANTMPAATLGQYKGLAFTRRVRPVSEKAVDADLANMARVHAPFVPTGGCGSRWILRAFWTASPSRTAGWKR